METLTDNMETLLTKLKNELNSHKFNYEDGCFISTLMEYHTVEHCFSILYGMIESDKDNYQTNYFELYNIQSALTDLLLCEKEIAKHKFYLKRVYGDVVHAYEVNDKLDNLINKYK